MAHLVDGTAKSIPKLFQLNMTMMDMSSDKSRFLRSLTPIECLSGLIELRTISMEPISGKQIKFKHKHNEFRLMVARHVKRGQVIVYRTVGPLLPGRSFVYVC